MKVWHYKLNQQLKNLAPKNHIELFQWFKTHYTPVRELSRGAQSGRFFVGKNQIFVFPFSGYDKSRVVWMRDVFSDDDENPTIFEVDWRKI